MTYLQLVNSVLRRLREEEVTTVDESDYSKLIGDFVNDSKRQVEDAWDWTALRNTYTLTTASGTATYALTDFGVRSNVLYVHNETTNGYINQESLQRIRQLSLGTDNAVGTPYYFAIENVDSNGDANIRFYQTPNTVNTISVYTVKRTGDLTTDTDTILVPTAPVVQYAFSFALRERGETGGQSAVEQAAFAKQDLNNAIAHDASLNPEGTLWTTI
jgi:hypothetical protein